MRRHFVILIAMLGCTGPTTGGTIHPTQENLSIPADLEGHIARTEGYPDDEEASLLLSRLRSPKLIWTVGQRDGPYDSVFGELFDGAISEHPVRAFALDGRFSTIRVYSLSGQFKGEFGGAGGGPGEFLSPQAINAKGGVAMVLDRHGYINVFVEQDGLYAFAEKVSLEASAEALCVFDHEVLIQGWSPKTDALFLIHDLDTRRTRWFGERYRSGNGLIRQQLSDAVVGCNQRFAVWMFEHVPIVNASDLVTGRLVWQSRIPKFQNLRIVETWNKNGRPRIEYEGDVYSVAHSVVALGEKHFLLQIATYEYSEEDGYLDRTTVETYLLKASNGEGWYLGKMLPTITAATDSLLLAQTNDPFPQLSLYRY